MRHVLGGLSVIALLAAALPAAAQTTAPTPSAQAAQKSDTNRPANPMRHKTRRTTASKNSANDNIADQLNQQELSQINQGQTPTSGTSTNSQAPLH